MEQHGRRYRILKEAGSNKVVLSAAIRMNPIYGSYRAIAPRRSAVDSTRDSTDSTALFPHRFMSLIGIKTHKIVCYSYVKCMDLILRSIFLLTVFL